MDASGIEAFEDRQGDFFVKLVAGDARVTRGIHQLVLDRVTLNYRPKHTPTPKGIFDFDMTTAKFYPQEELEHDLKTPRKRAPIFLSFLFTGLVLLPLLVYIFWVCCFSIDIFFVEPILCYRYSLLRIYFRCDYLLMKRVAVV